MPQRSAFNSDFRFSLFFLSYAKSIDYRGKKIQFPQPFDRLQPLARIHRNRQRLPSNGSIERAQSTSPDFTLLRKRASDRALTFIKH
jgi:hypothetical protein